MKSRIDLLLKILAADEDDTEDDEKNSIYTMLLYTSPKLLTVPEKQIMESYNWIKQRFGNWDHRLSRMLGTKGGFLLLLRTETLEKNADMLQSDLSLSDEELASLVFRCPAIFESIVDEKDTRFEKHGYHAMKRHFQEYYGFEDEEIKQFILKNPNQMREFVHKDPARRFDEWKGKSKKLRLLARAIETALAEGPNPLETSPEARLMPLPPEIELHYSKVGWDYISLTIRRIHLIFNDIKSLFEDEDDY